MYNINNIYNNYIDKCEDAVEKDIFKKICEEFNIEIIEPCRVNEQLLSLLESKNIIYNARKEWNNSIQTFLEEFEEDDETHLVYHNKCIYFSNVNDFCKDDEKIFTIEKDIFRRVVVE